MANVDPFVIRWPKKWESDPELRDVLRYLNRFLHDLWIRTGGGPDLIEGGLEGIEDLQDQINVINDRLDAIDIRLDLIEADIADLQARVIGLEGLTVVTAVDYTIDGTVTGHQTIVCTADLTVSLDPAPSDRDTATIKVGQKNTKVIIDGNGKLIEEDSTMTLRRRNTKIQIGIDLEFSAELDRWIAK
jgi:hypothetical protein